MLPHIYYAITLQCDSPILHPHNNNYYPINSPINNNNYYPHNNYITALLTIPSQQCYPNTCTAALILILSASRPYYHAPKNNSCLSLVPRLTPDAAQATADAHGCASSGAAGGTQRPRYRPRICYVLLSYCVSCFVICYPISPDQDHKPRGRASDVSTISTCFSFMSWFTAHYPTNLCEKGWGYHCRVLVRLLALLC